MAIELRVLDIAADSVISEQRVWPEGRLLVERPSQPRRGAPSWSGPSDDTAETGPAHSQAQIHGKQDGH